MNKKMKKSISAVLICAMMLTTTTTALDATAFADNTSVSTTASNSKSYKITSKKVKTYYFGTSADKKSTVKLYFMNGSDVPYMEINDWLTYCNKMRETGWVDSSYKFTGEKKGDIVTLSRKNGYSAVIDFAEDTIFFYDYNAFTGVNGEVLNDIFFDPSTMGTKESPRYIKQLPTTNMRYGDKVTMDLGAYDIDLVHKGSKYYIPVQTLADVFMTATMTNMIYNGKSLIFYGGDTTLGTPDGKLTKLGKIYYKGDASGKISKEMAKFNYNELCFAFDHLYGLKEIHGIKSFRDLVQQRGMEDIFLGTDSKAIDEALYRLINENIDDLHSTYILPSYASGSDYGNEVKVKCGPSRSSTNMMLKYMTLKSLASKKYPNGVPGYEEIGDTAFISFDSFEWISDGVDYYKNAPTADSKDTVGIVAYSVQQILRKDSPIKNVVLDLSRNPGGAVPAAGYTVGAFIGWGSLSVASPDTGALVTHDFMVDTNFDGVFDDKDNLRAKGLNLYCLTSSLSFSCGNLVPNAFKNSNCVALIGQTTGGGSCAVLPMTTAAGSVFNMSSSLRMSFLKNGSFYDIDRGVDPDIPLTKDESFLDRQKLVEMIDSLL